MFSGVQRLAILWSTGSQSVALVGNDCKLQNTIDTHSQSAEWEREFIH